MVLWAADLNGRELSNSYKDFVASKAELQAPHTADFIQIDFAETALFVHETKLLACLYVGGAAMLAKASSSIEEFANLKSLVCVTDYQSQLEVLKTAERDRLRRAAAAALLRELLPAYSAARTAPLLNILLCAAELVDRNDVVKLRKLEAIAAGVDHQESRHASADVVEHKEAIEANKRADGLPPLSMRRKADVNLKQHASSRNKRTPLDLSKINLPKGLEWPSDTYSIAASTKGENIVQYLERAWKKLIAAGIATREVVELFDNTTIVGIKNYTRQQPGKPRRIIPDYLRPITKSEFNTRIINADPTIVTRDKRFAAINASRLARASNT